MSGFIFLLINIHCEGVWKRDGVPSLLLRNKTVLPPPQSKRTGYGKIPFLTQQKSQNISTCHGKNNELFSNFICSIQVCNTNIQTSVLFFALIRFHFSSSPNPDMCISCYWPLLPSLARGALKYRVVLKSYNAHVPIKIFCHEDAASLNEEATGTGRSQMK